MGTARKTRLLLINPKFPESFWSFQWAMRQVLPGKKTVNPPLGLATLAALSPDHWEIQIVDENVESIPLDTDADIVGVCGMGVQFSRQAELLNYYRAQGHYVVAGGSYASLCPEEYAELADSVVAGEAEYIWKDFCQDFERQSPKPLYRETGEVALEDSPVPRFDLLDMDRYQSVSLQFSRGCPFRCEFCDIIVMFGRKPRCKSMDQVGRELDVLRSMGIRRAFFVDDNLIGHKPIAKELLRFLRDYQREHDYTFQFGTEASLNLAQDDELLALFREANFEWVFIGIESPDEESLKETKKFQNVREDILTSLRRVYTSGLDVFAGFIVGFDNDTIDTFDLQYRFIINSGIQAAMVGLLTAAPKTPLYERLERDGRLLAGANNSDNTKLTTNVIPLRMTYDELVEGYRQLFFRLLEDRGIARRIRNKLRYLTRPSFREEFSTRENLALLWRLITRGLLPGGWSRVRHFLGSVPWTRPKLIPLAVQDWIIGLAMHDYVQRHFQPQPVGLTHRLEKRLTALERTLREYVRSGALELSVDNVKQSAGELSLRFKGWLDRDFFDRAARQLETVLKHSAASLTLHIEDFHLTQQEHLREMLDRLSRHGDRISVRIKRDLRHLIEIDSSVFNLVLES